MNAMCVAGIVITAAFESFLNALNRFARYFSTVISVQTNFLFQTKNKTILFKIIREQFFNRQKLFAKTKKNTKIHRMKKTHIKANKFLNKKSFRFEFKGN